MTTSRGMPQRSPGRCPNCDAPLSAGAQERYGHMACPRCGKWLWFATQRDGTWFHDAEKAAAVRRRLVAIVAENLGVNAPQVRDTTSFMGDIGADTLDVVEFVIEVEKEFHITIPDAHAEMLMTVGDLLDYVLRQLR